MGDYYEELNNVSDLDGLIWSYKQNKESLDNYKKATDEQNSKIKEIMQANNISKYNTINGLQAQISIQKRESFIDSKLLAKLKELGVTSPIKTVEVVDMDELENVIYNHQLDAAELTDCKQVKEVVTLKVK